MTDVSEPLVRTATAPAERFAIAVEPERDVLKIAPRGELDLATAGQLQRALADHLNGCHARLVIDLRGVEFIDSSGLDALLTAHHQARRDNRALTIIPGSRSVQRIFEITRTVDQLPFATASGSAGTP